MPWEGSGTPSRPRRRRGSTLPSQVSGRSGSVGERRLPGEETVTLNVTGGCLVPALELCPAFEETERDRPAPVREHQSALGHAAARLDEPRLSDPLGEDVDRARRVEG